MTNQTKSKKLQKAQRKGGERKVSWVWIAIVVAVSLGVVFAVWRERSKHVFILPEGDRDLVVLIRTDEVGNYRIEYVGNQPVELQSLLVMLEGQILHMDVKQVILTYEGQEVVVGSDGNLPTGQAFVLQSGESFGVRVTFRGQTLGGNYLYGFRIGYLRSNRSITYDMQLNHEYTIIVE